MAEIEKSLPISKDALGIVLRSVDRFPKNNHFVHHSQIKVLNGIRTDFKKLVRAIREGETRNWEEICNLRQRLVDVLNEGDGAAQIRKIIDECIAAIQLALAPKKASQKRVEKKHPLYLQAIQRARAEMVAQHSAHGKIILHRIAQAAGLTEDKFREAFLAVYGMTPSEFLASLKKGS